jgi:hypothetical protein
MAMTAYLPFVLKFIGGLLFMRLLASRPVAGFS